MLLISLMVVPPVTAGSYSSMVPDAECVTVACEILSGLPIGNFMVKVNHRKLLDAVLEVSGVGPEMFRTICSAVDKLDKEPWEVVKKEMVMKESEALIDAADQGNRKLVKVRMDK